MIAKIVALLEGLRADDLDVTPPAHLQRFSALCRHWAGLAEIRASPAPKTGVLKNLKEGDRSE